MWLSPAAVVFALAVARAPVDVATDHPAGDATALRIGPRSALAPAMAEVDAAPGVVAVAQTSHPLPEGRDRLPTSLTHAPHAGALEIVGLIQFLFEHDTGRTLGEDRSGAELNEVLLVAQGVAGAWTLYAEVDAARGDVGLGEAWGDVALDAHHNLRIGRVQRRFLASQEWPDDSLVMAERSFVDAATTVQSEGAMLAGDYDRLRVAATLQNGPDGPGSDWLGSLRAEFDVLGGGVAPRGDGWRAPRHALMTAGIAVADDGSVEEGGSLALDAQFRFEGFGVFVEWVDLGRDVGDAQPLAVTLAAELERDVLEAGLRYQQLDDASDTDVIGAALTRWVVPGRLKVQAGIDRVRSDDDALQGTRFLVGTVLSF